MTVSSYGRTRTSRSLPVSQHCCNHAVEHTNARPPTRPPARKHAAAGKLMDEQVGATCRPDGGRRSSASPFRLHLGIADGMPCHCIGIAGRTTIARVPGASVLKNDRPWPRAWPLSINPGPRPAGQSSSRHPKAIGLGRELYQR